MKKRTVLYGYQIQHGDFVVVPAEQAIVKRIFVDYHRGGSYQKIADQLNAEKIPFYQGTGGCDKHKVTRLLEDPRYIGEKRYPALIDQKLFQIVQEEIKHKAAHCRKKDGQAKKLSSELLRGRKNSEGEEHRSSEQVICLQNAIDRAMEVPEDPEKILALILQAISARYACCSGLE